jgi:hypothetical protein
LASVRPHRRHPDDTFRLLGCDREPSAGDRGAGGPTRLAAQSVPVAAARPRGTRRSARGFCPAVERDPSPRASCRRPSAPCRRPAPASTWWPARRARPGGSPSSTRSRAAGPAGRSDWRLPRIGPELDHAVLHGRRSVSARLHGASGHRVGQRGARRRRSSVAARTAWSFRRLGARRPPSDQVLGSGGESATRLRRGVRALSTTTSIARPCHVRRACVIIRQRDALR